MESSLTSKRLLIVNLHILLKKLEHYGITGNSNKWFASYLNSRKQFVSINWLNSNLADAADVKCGAPQGSILVPLLLLIRINDLHLAIKYSEVHHFTDDTNLLNFNSCVNSIYRQVNLGLKNFRSNHRRCSIKRTLLKKSLFLKKLLDFRPVTLDSYTGGFLWILWNF